jgi:hypothetical protein
VQNGKRWGLKDANVILEVLKVNAQFSADACINLRQQCGGYQDEVDTSLVSRCAKASHISEHAAANNYKHRVPVQLHGGHLFPYLSAGGKIFILLSTGNCDLPMGREGAFYQWIAMPGGMIVGQDSDPGVTFGPEKVF